MSVLKSENASHNANALAAEQTRQASMAGVTTQAGAIAADIAFYRTLLASALSNKCGTSAYMSALMALGVRP